MKQVCIFGTVSELFECNSETCKLRILPDVSPSAFQGSFELYPR